MYHVRSEEKSDKIEMVRRIGNSLSLYSKRGMHRLQMMSERTVRITYTEGLEGEAAL